MLGDDWVQRQRRVVQQHNMFYQRAAWNKVCNSCHAVPHRWKSYFLKRVGNPRKSFYFQRIQPTCLNGT